MATRRSFSWRSTSEMQRMPKHIKEWLALYADVPAMMLKCPMCGSWYESIDHLAPYHWEMCWCGKCQMHPVKSDY